MHRARVERVARDLKNCTIQDLLGVATLLLREDTEYAKRLVGALSDAVDVVASKNTPMYRNTMEMIYGKESIWLNSAGNTKIHVIKTVRKLCGIGLKEAKLLVDDVPSVLPSINVPISQALRMLNVAGASASSRKTG